GGRSVGGGRAGRGRGRRRRGRRRGRRVSGRVGGRRGGRSRGRRAAGGRRGVGVGDVDPAPHAGELAVLVGSLPADSGVVVVLPGLVEDDGEGVAVGREVVGGLLPPPLAVRDVLGRGDVVRPLLDEPED